MLLRVARGNYFEEQAAFCQNFFQIVSLLEFLLSLLLFVYEFRVFGRFQTCLMSGMIQFTVTLSCAELK